MIFHPAMMPKVTIYDPASLIDMPKPITAGACLNALAHCLEAYCTRSYHPMAEGMALEGSGLVKTQLP